MSNIEQRDDETETEFIQRLETETKERTLAEIAAANSEETAEGYLTPEENTMAFTSNDCLALLQLRGVDIGKSLGDLEPTLENLGNLVELQRNGDESVVMITSSGGDVSLHLASALLSRNVSEDQKLAELCRNGAAETSLGKAIKKGTKKQLVHASVLRSFYDTFRTMAEVMAEFGVGQITTMDLIKTDVDDEKFTPSVLLAVRAMMKVLVHEGFITTGDAKTTLKNMRTAAKLNNRYVQMRLTAMLYVQAAKAMPLNYTMWQEAVAIHEVFDLDRQELAAGMATLGSEGLEKLKIEDQSEIGPLSWGFLTQTHTALGSLGKTLHQKNVSQIFSITPSHLQRSSNCPDEALDLGKCSAEVCRFLHGSDPCKFIHAKKPFCRFCLEDYGPNHQGFGHCPNRASLPSFLQFNGKKYKFGGKPGKEGGGRPLMRKTNTLCRGLMSKRSTTKIKKGSESTNWRKVDRPPFLPKLPKHTSHHKTPSAHIISTLKVDRPIVPILKHEKASIYNITEVGPAFPVETVPEAADNQVASVVKTKVAEKQVSKVEATQDEAVVSDQVESAGVPQSTSDYPGKTSNDNTPFGTITGADAAYIRSLVWGKTEQCEPLENRNWIPSQTRKKHRGVVKFYTDKYHKRQAPIPWGFIEPFDKDKRDIHFTLFALQSINEAQIKKGLVVEYTFIPGHQSAETVDIMIYGNTGEGKRTAMVDTGAHMHATNDRHSFCNYRQLEQPIPVGTAHDGDKIFLRGIGDVYMINDRTTYLFRNVFYAPECASTLISVRMLGKEGGWQLQADENLAKLTNIRTKKSIILDESFRFKYAYERNTVDKVPKAQFMTEEELSQIPGMEFVTAGDNKVCVINALNAFESDLAMLHKCKTPMVGYFLDGLMRFQPMEIKDDTSFCKWHRRLGHQSQNYIKKFALAQGIQLSGDLGDHVCETCALSKMTQARSTNSRPRASKFLQRIHADTIGPFKPIGRGDKVYALVVVDCHTRSVFTYLQKTNSADETHASLERFCTEVEGRPQELQVDGGSEFKGVCEKWCTQHKIKLQKSPPYAQYLNGTVERKVRSLKEMTRCLLSHSQLPHSYWPDALLTAQYIITRSPTTSLPKWQSPWQMRYGQPSKYEHMRVFGSKVIYKQGDKTFKNPDTLQSSTSSEALQDRGREGVFLGFGVNYPTGTYRILDTETMQVVHSNRAEFFENQNVQDTRAWGYLTSPETEWEEYQQDTTYEPDEEEFEPEMETYGPIVTNTRTRRNRKQTSRYDPAVEASRQQLLQTPSGNHPVLALYLVNGVLRDTGLQAALDANTQKELEQPTTKEKWAAAKAKELAQFERFKAFTVVDRDDVPKGFQILPTHFVRTIKSDGRYKYRLVADGNRQDGASVFSPTAALTSLRMVTAHATMEGHVLRQGDVSAAYLQSPIQDTQYVEQPPDKTIDRWIRRRKVWRLNKAMYGLRQSPLAWYKTVVAAMEAFGLKPTSADACVFRGKGLVVGVWVDDFLYSGPPNVLNAFEEYLVKTFTMSVPPADADVFCGIEINQSVRDGKRRVTLSQDRYIDELMETFKVDPAVVTTPIKTYLPPCAPGEADNTTKFRELLGGIMYVMIATRPDLAFSVHHLSRFGQNHGKTHYEAAVRVLQYLHYTREKKITYEQGGLHQLETYSDANWAGCPFTRKSTSGRIVFYGGAPVSWCSQLQRAISTSSCESELYAVTDAVKETVYLRILLEDIRGEKIPPSTLFCDNHATVHICAGQDANLKRLRHLRQLQRFLDIRRRFIETQMHEVSVVHCSADEMLADLMTKPLGPLKLKANVDKILSSGSKLNETPRD